MAKSDYKFEQHPLYGKIRLRRLETTGKDGKRYEWWEYDPTYSPPTPRDAVPGDPTQQVFCALHNVPKYFYIDEERTCVDCGNSFVFRAEEQRFWYETLKFNLHSVAIRCRECRQRKRGESSLHSRVAAARTAVAQNPESPQAHLDLAEALLRLRENTGHGNLDDVISASRKARELWPDTGEFDFWEGLAHHLAGRPQRAKEYLTAFITWPASRTLRDGELLREARTVVDDASAV